MHNAKVRGMCVSSASNEEAKTNTGSERDLHAQIFDECRRRGWIPLHGSMSERTHRTAGEPDFIIVRDGGVLFVECKTRTGKLTREQQAMIAHAAKLGHTIHVVRSFQEFLNTTQCQLSNKHGVT